MDGHMNGFQLILDVTVYKSSKQRKYVQEKVTPEAGET